MLNRFVIGLVRAALGLKRQRAQAEALRLKQLEEQRQREEEARRLAKAELRWLEEQGRVERLERFAKMWRRNQELRRVVADIREAAGEVDAESELEKWLVWAVEHAEDSAPLQHLRKRNGRTLTLYYYGYDKDSVAEGASRSRHNLPSGRRRSRLESS